MESRVSATGLKSVELDELTTDQIIINNEGLQYLHKYNILLPTMTEGYYNLQEELALGLTGFSSVANKQETEGNQKNLRQ